MPSGEVRIAPAPPTTTNWPLTKVMPYKSFVVPEVRLVQVMLSGDVWIVPVVPTATNWPLPKATAMSDSSVKLGDRLVQTILSEEVKIGTFDTDSKGG